MENENDSIEFIYAPFVFTKKGKRHFINKLIGEPRIGALISAELEVLTSEADPNCVGGVCPIK